MNKICLMLILAIISPVEVKAYGTPYYLAIKSYGCEIDLLLQDYNSKRIGYDFKTGKDIIEIEQEVGGYIHDFSDNSGEPTKEIDYRDPKSGLYELQVYAHQEKQYLIYVRGNNELMERFQIKIIGKLLKGDVHNYDILYSCEAHEKTTATKVLDLNVYEREAKAIFNNENSEINKIMKEVFGNIKKAKKVMKKDSAKAKKYIETIAEVTENARKGFLASSGKPMDLSLDYKFDRVNTWEWYRDNVLKYDILIIDAKELVKQIK